MIMMNDDFDAVAAAVVVFVVDLDCGGAGGSGGGDDGRSGGDDRDGGGCGGCRGGET